MALFLFSYLVKCLQAYLPSLWHQHPHTHTAKGSWVRGVNGSQSSGHTPSAKWWLPTRGCSLPKKGVPFIIFTKASPIRSTSQDFHLQYFIIWRSQLLSQTQILYSWGFCVPYMTWHQISLLKEIFLLLNFSIAITVPTSLASPRWIFLNLFFLLKSDIWIDNKLYFNNIFTIP